MIPLHQHLTLYTDGNDAYIFVPTNQPGAQYLTVNRNSGDIILSRPNAPIPSSAQQSPKLIYGILGTIALSLSEYFILLTGRNLEGRLMGHEVYRASEFEILPLHPNASVQDPPHQAEAHLLSLVKSHLNSASFLFSYTWDLTRRLQSQQKEEDQQKGLWELADDRFFWNKFIQSRLVDSIDVDRKQDLSPYILPVLYGTFEQRPAHIRGHHIQLYVISRRSRYRAGTRYFRRGIDHEGHVANFIETEQLLLVEDEQQPGQMTFDRFAAKLSFVQIRGSAPLFWAEINTLLFKPDLQIMDLQETPSVLRRHLEAQKSEYGEVTLVNLIDQVGHEKPVKEAYERYLSLITLPEVRYEYFDFHNECKNMRWDRLSLLIDILEKDLIRQGYFHVGGLNQMPDKEQRGIVRTNCMDCLDRTNVMQATLAKWTLNKQLESLGILPKGESIDDYEAASKDFREIWANHGDKVAVAYGGSGAMKSDFTRLNKRTKMGVLQDGCKSLLRYIKNNHFDGAKQDSLDLFTGTWIPRKGPSGSMFILSDDRPLFMRSMPYMFSFSLFMVCAGLTLPRTSDYSLFYYFMFWFMFLSMSLTFIIVHGIEYVSWPRLIPFTDIVHYNGPGYRSARHGMGVGWLAQAFDLLQSKGAEWIHSGDRRRAGNRIEEIEMGTKKRVD